MIYQYSYVFFVDVVDVFSSCSFVSFVFEVFGISSLGIFCGIVFRLHVLENQI